MADPSDKFDEVRRAWVARHGEERIPVRQRNGCKFKTLSIGKCNAAAALLAFDRRSANQFTYRRNLLRFAELVGGPFHELIHARMARKHFFLKAPDLTEAVVPQVQIGRAHV